MNKDIILSDIDRWLGWQAQELLQCMALKMDGRDKEAEQIRDQIHSQWHKADILYWHNMDVPCKDVLYAGLASARDYLQQVQPPAGTWTDRVPAALEIARASKLETYSFSNN